MWHEIGHLLVDLKLIEKYPEISIKEILIRNYECENVSWCGWVDLEPKSKLDYKEVIKDASLAAFKFFSLPNGCLLQAQKGSDNIEFNDCFAFKRDAIGKGDHDKFWELAYQLSCAYKVTNDEKKAFYKDLNIIVFEKYITEVSRLNDFQKELGKVITRESKVILDDYIAKETPDDYSFKFEGDYLVDLSKELTSLMIDNGFTDIVEDLHLELTTIITKYIIKK